MVGNCRNDRSVGQNLRPWGLESRAFGAFWDAIKPSLGTMFTHTKIRDVENCVEVLDVNDFRNPKKEIIENP